MLLTVQNRECVALQEFSLPHVLRARAVWDTEIMQLFSIEAKLILTARLVVISYNLSM